MSDVKQQSQERFGRFAERYVHSKTHAEDTDLNRLVSIAQAAGLNDTWRVLDVATGGGHTALRFAPLVKEVIASDITPAMLAAAKANITSKGIANVAFHEADAESLPFADQEFDMVTCRIAPHHFPNIGLFVAEVVRVLKTHGVFLLQDQVVSEDTDIDAYMNAFEKLRDPSHNRSLPVSEWTTLIEAAGMTIHHSEPFVKRHNLVQWAKVQDNNDATIAELQRRLSEATDDAKAWMLPEEAGTTNATFANHHIILLARKI